MTAQLLIDNIDVYAIYGVLLTDGAFKSLVQYPSLKSVSGIDWAEDDGKDFDLSNPQLDSREVSLSFGCLGMDRASEFVDLLTSAVYHTFKFCELGRTYKLRLTAHPNLRMLKTFDLFTLQFADDFPLMDYEYLAPQSTYNLRQGYLFDYIIRYAEINQDVTVVKSLSDYGVYVLSGIDQVLKPPNVKKNLLRNINSQSGIQYVVGKVVYDTKEVALDCLLRANSLEEFWRNYDALLYDLTRSQERCLYVGSQVHKFPCHYKSSSVKEFHITGTRVFFQFSITLVITSFRKLLKQNTMNEFYSGSDIPITITGGDRNLDEDNFEIWHYVYSNSIHKMRKSEMTRLDTNTYQGIIISEDTVMMGTGVVAMEIKFVDISHNIVDVQKVDGVFIIKKSLIGKL